MGETSIARFSRFVYDSRMVGRIGIFFLILGAFLVLLFVAADVKNAEAIRFLCFGVPLLGLGFFFWNRSRSKSEAERFRGIRKIFVRKKK